MSIEKYIPFYLRNLKVALPIVCSQLGGAVVQVIDSVMVGKLGTVPLAAVSFATAVFVIGFIFSMGILMGLTPLVGIAFVRKERRRVTELFQNAMLLAGLVSVLTCVLLYGITFIMPYMGQDAEVVATCLPYFYTLIASLVPFLLFMTIKQFFEGLGNTWIAMLITLLANIINVVFNYLLIFGKCGFPEWGIVGAGVATLISRVSMPLLFLLAMRLRASWWRHLTDFRRTFFSRARFYELVKVGTPIAIHMLMEVAAFAFSGIMIGWLGAVPLAGHQIAQNMSHLTFMVVLGIGGATTIRVSHQLGQRDLYAARMAGNASVHLCLLYSTCAASLLILFRHAVAGIFSTDPAVIEIGSQLLIMAGIFQLSDGLQMVGAGILRGLTDVKIVTLYAFISYVCVNIPCSYFLGFVLGWGSVGVWTGFIFGLSVAAVLFHLRLRKTFRSLSLSSKYTPS